MTLGPAMNESMRRQDRSDLLGLFHNGRRVGAMADSTPAEAVNAARDLAAAQLGVEPYAVEVLKVCPDHPGASAVDCLDHEDEDDDLLIGPPGTGWCGTCNRRDVPMVRTEDDSVLAEHDGCPGAGDREYGWWHDEHDDWSD